MKALRQLKPPFAKILCVPANATVYIFSGGNRAWNRAKGEYDLGIKRSLVFAADKDPFQFRWPVNGRTVIHIDYAPTVNETLIKKLSFALLQSGAEGVITIHAATNQTYRYEGVMNACA